MTKRFTLLAAIGLVFLFTHINAYAATREISGGGSAQWQDVNNWVDGILPVNGDAVTSDVNNLATYVDGSINLTLTGMAFSKATSITLWSGANLIINGNITNTANLSITVQNGATLTVNGEINAGNGDAYINVESGGVMTVTGGLSALGNNGTALIAGGDLNIGGVVTVKNGLDLDVYSSGDLEIGGLTTGNSAVITIDGDALIDGDVDLGTGTDLDVYSGSTLTTTGDFVAEGGSASYVIDGNFIVGGNLDIDGKPMTIYSGASVVVGGTCESLDGTPGDVDRIECGVTRAVALPVTLLEFDGVLQGNMVVLDWSTASEVDNDYFTIKRSFDGLEFTNLTFVQGGGTTNKISYYQYEDYIGGSTLDTPVYYELSQTDYDGTYEKLKVIVFGKGELSQMSLLPNIVEENSSINVSGATAELSWKIVSLSGAALKSGNFINSPQVSVEGLQNGQYFLQVQTAKGDTRTMRFVVK